MVLALALAAILERPLPPPARTMDTPDLATGCGVAPVRAEIKEPLEVRSHGGLVELTLVAEGQRIPAQTQLMCYMYKVQTPEGVKRVTVPPTIRVRQGDRIVLTLVNDLREPPHGTNELQAPLSIGRGVTDEDRGGGGVGLMCGQPQTMGTPPPNPRTGRIYGYHRSPWNEENMHFHGLNTSPKQPSDDVVNVLLCPRKAPTDPPRSYTYVVDIPRDEPPGLYWYHPHPHGESEHQVQAGMTGVIIVQPIVASIPDQMPNEIIIVRDFLSSTGTLRNKRLEQTTIPDFMDIRKAVATGVTHVNDGNDSYRDPFGKPAPCPSMLPNGNTKELTVNYIPLPIGFQQIRTQVPPHLTVPAGQTQYWRLANTASDTVLDLQLRDEGKILPLQVVERDGVPLVQTNGHPTWQAVPMDHVIVPPAGRVEFYLMGTNPGHRMLIVTKKFDAGCVGDLELERSVVTIHVSASEGSQRIVPPRAVDPVPTRFSTLAEVKPSKTRVFAFTEYDRRDEGEPDFYITEISNKKAVETPFMMDLPPAVTVREGAVEDWILLNYTQEVHEFHIHQIHFLVLQAGGGIPGGQSQLLDTVNVPFGYFPNGGTGKRNMTPGMVRLRMDFRGPDIVGTFVYHCHILEHEDNGMMQKIRVLPANADVSKADEPTRPQLPDVAVAAPGDHLDLSGLVDQDGRAFPSGGASGKVLLASFVSTRCPDGYACPLTSGKFAYLQAHIDPAREHLVQFTLDPKTDTLVALRDYGKRFGTDARRWSFVTGSSSKLLPLAARLGEPKSGSLRDPDALAVIGPDGTLRSIQRGDWQPVEAIAAARTPAVARNATRQQPVAWLALGPVLMLPMLAELTRRRRRRAVTPRHLL